MGHKRILVVEDENIVAMDIQFSLQKLGYDVPLTVGSSSDAIQATRDLKPDLVLMDIQIQGDKDGVQTALEIWGEFHVPIIFLTAYADETTLTRAKEAEPFGYILKPFQESELRTAVEIALQKYQSVHEREMKDLSERKVALENLQNTREILQSLLDFAPSVIFVKDLEGRYMHVNASFLSLVQKKSEDVLGKTDFDFFEEEMAKKYRQNDQIILREQRSQQMEEVTFINGQERIYLSTKFPIWDLKGKVYAIGGISNDITDRKQLEAQRIHLLKELQSTLKTREDFISIASHELRTPMTSMKLSSQTLLKKLASKSLVEIGKEALMKALSRMDGELNRLNCLVEDMLDISRIASGRFSLEFVHSDLSELLARVLKENEERLALAGIDVRCEIEKEVLGLWDSHRIGQAINNVISNAIKYAGGHPLEVVLVRVQGRALLSIKDYGPGIREVEQERIFRIFERAIEGINISGFGLGLYIANHIILLHGGKLVVTSRPGDGAKFIFDIPLEDAYLKMALGKRRDNRNFPARSFVDE